MKDDYAGVFRQTDAVAKYEDVVYAEDSYASRINRRQRQWLRSLVSAEFRPGQVTQHDFACGTGRALESLAGTVRAAHGYDTSAAMLERALTKAIDAEFHFIDADGAPPEPIRGDGPSIVTVFRLFLNASPEVWDRTMAFAASALPTPGSGLLVVENHGNRRSMRHLRRRRRRQSDEWFNELSTAQVADLFARFGFTLQSMHGFAVLPKGAYRIRRLRRAAAAIDNVASRLPFLAGVSTNVVYVGRRREDS